jgi:hypothetical protein
LLADHNRAATIDVVPKATNDSKFDDVNMSGDVVSNMNAGCKMRGFAHEVI